jgi:AGCS family alanine or glycine:cation symporter
MDLSIILTAPTPFWQYVSENIYEMNGKVSEIVWGVPMLLLMIGAGVYLSFLLGFFQVFRFKHWWKHTVVALFRDKKVTKSKDSASISQFQALATALASTLGTGNIVGVATAITAGGPGAIFWMWVSAFFGMMTNFAEKILGIYFRYKNVNGEWTGGAMIYIERGLKMKRLAVLFSVFCVFASFGIGNIAQVNGIAVSMKSAFNIPHYATGALSAALVGLVILGGLKRIAKVSEKLVPLMSIIYFAAVVAVIGVNFRQIPAAFLEIFSGAFSLKSAGGGIMGYTVARAARFGIARGVFSNEAGLGSSVIVHSASDVKEPVEQGMWAIFEVFFDTIFICTLSALAILTTGAHGVLGLEGAEIPFYAFASVLGSFGEYIVTVSIMLFAFLSIIGWSYYGTKSIEYLGGAKIVPYYKLIFVVVVYVGAVSGVKLVWELSDTFNGLMAIPNLFAIFALSGTIYKIVKNYNERVFKGRRDLPPMLTYKGPIP